MNIVLTGAGSGLGSLLLTQILENPDVETVWCGVHRRSPSINDKRVRTFSFDLGSPKLDGIEGSIDRVVHVAGLTHTNDESEYHRINTQGTEMLAQEALSRGIRDFVYVSSRCAVADAGAYGVSKLKAEEALAALDWHSLVLLRPAEVYGLKSSEGIDRLIAVAERFRIVPLLFGHRGIRFSPLHEEDFLEACSYWIGSGASGNQAVELCGPEDLDGFTVATRIARKIGAIPVPIWLPALQAAAAVLRCVGISLVASDQFSRLLSAKTSIKSTAFPNGWVPKRRFFS